MITPFKGKNERLTKIVLVSTAAFMGFLTISSLSEQPNIQEGYINPKNIEIKVQDLDTIPRNETYMKIDKKDYLLKYDSTGRPAFVDYLNNK